MVSKLSGISERTSLVHADVAHAVFTLYLPAVSTSPSWHLGEVDLLIVQTLIPLEVPTNVSSITCD